MVRINHNLLEKILYECDREIFVTMLQTSKILHFHKHNDFTYRKYIDKLYNNKLDKAMEKNDVEAVDFILHNNNDKYYPINIYEINGNNYQKRLKIIELLIKKYNYVLYLNKNLKDIPNRYYINNILQRAIYKNDVKSVKNILYSNIGKFHHNNIVKIYKINTFNYRKRLKIIELLIDHNCENRYNITTYINNVMI